MATSKKTIEKKPTKKTTEKTYNLIKENGQWVIFFDWEKEIKIKKLNLRKKNTARCCKTVIMT